MELTIEYLKKEFKTLNKRFFNNELPEIEFRLGTMTKAVAYYAWRKTWQNDGYKLSEYIRFSKKFKYTKKDINNVLAHEMIHYYIHFKDIKDTSSHGKKFLEMMNHINNTSELKLSVLSSIKYKTEPEPKNNKVTQFRLIKYTVNDKIAYSRISKNYKIADAIERFNIKNVVELTSTNNKLIIMKENRCGNRFNYYSEDLFKQRFGNIELHQVA